MRCEKRNQIVGNNVVEKNYCLPLRYFPSEIPIFVQVKKHSLSGGSIGFVVEISTGICPKIPTKFFLQPCQTFWPWISKQPSVLLALAVPETAGQRVSGRDQWKLAGVVEGTANLVGPSGTPRCVSPPGGPQTGRRTGGERSVQKGRGGGVGADVGLRRVQTVCRQSYVEPNGKKTSGKEGRGRRKTQFKWSPKFALQRRSKEGSPQREILAQKITILEVGSFFSWNKKNISWKSTQNFIPTRKRNCKEFPSPSLICLKVKSAWREGKELKWSILEEQSAQQDLSKVTEIVDIRPERPWAFRKKTTVSYKRRKKSTFIIIFINPCIHSISDVFKLYLQGRLW